MHYHEKRLDVYRTGKNNLKVRSIYTVVNKLRIWNVIPKIG